MKELRLLLVLLIVGITSCTYTIDSQVREKVYGKGPVTTTEREAGQFTGLKVSTGIDVYLSQGSTESIKVEADENLHSHILTEIKDGYLHVYTKSDIREAKSKKVYVTMKDITSIKTTSAGDVIGQTPVKAESLELSTSSAGDIVLDIQVKTLVVDGSSSGDITLSGSAETIEASMSSAGDLKAYDLTVKDAEINVSSAGDAKITVTESLKARASSAGDIYYRGEPAKVDVRTSSAGGIHNR